MKDRKIVGKAFCHPFVNARFAQLQNLNHFVENQCAIVSVCVGIHRPPVALQKKKDPTNDKQRNNPTTPRLSLDVKSVDSMQMQLRKHGEQFTTNVVCRSQTCFGDGVGD
jgi:hypothetical protein